MTVTARGPAGQAAMAYFGHVIARDAQSVAALFSEAGKVVFTSGDVATGRAAIAAAYKAIHDSAPPTPSVACLIEDGRRCAVEVEVTWSSGQAARVTDVFKVDEQGMIRSLRVYRQGG